MNQEHFIKPKTIKADLPLETFANVTYNTFIQNHKELKFMLIVMLEPLGVSEQTVLELAKPLIDLGHELVFCGEKLNEAEKIERAKDADVLIVANSPLSEDIILAAPNLKMISVAFTGVDHIPAICNEKGILVCNAQGYCTDAVAELTFGLILAVYRNILPCDARTRESSTKDGLVGNEIAGKTIGIVGTGAIGCRVAEIGKVFGCELLGYSRTEREEAKKLGVKYCSLDELMKKADIITLHTPLTAETKLLINKERIGMMKPNAIIVNMARGGVIDSQALAEALNSGKIAGAGIDVFENEPPVEANHPLLHSKNTVLTPHVAFATKESMVRRCGMVVDNITAWLDGKPINVKMGVK